jgi:hypothetical protein
MGYDGEERRVNQGDKCDLYHKCFQITTGWELFAKEVTHVKNSLEEVKKAEADAVVKRDETNSTLNHLKKEFKLHREEFKQHGIDEMQTVTKQTEALERQNDVISELSVTLKELHESHMVEKQDQHWMKIFGYGMATIFGSALIWLFLNVNSTDKLLVKMSTNLEHNTEALKELKGYFRGDK